MDKMDVDVFNLTDDEFNALKWHEGRDFSVLVGVVIIYVEPSVCWYQSGEPVYDAVLIYGYKNGKKIIISIGFNGLADGIDDGLYINYVEIE